MEGSFEGFLEKNLKETHVGIPRDLSGQISVGTPKRISEVIPGAISGEKCLGKFLEESQVKFWVGSNPWKNPRSNGGIFKAIFGGIVGGISCGN